MPKYSIVVPLHNEQENVTDLYARLKSVMEASGETFEMVLVDDPAIRTSRLALCDVTARVLESGLSLLGIEAPAQM